MSRLTMAVRETGRILDTSAKGAEEGVAFFTALCVLQSGEILAVCQLGPAKHAPSSTLRLCRSTDGGRHWTEESHRFSANWQGKPGSYGAGELVEVSSDRLLLFATWFDRSEPERPLFDPVTQGILKSKQLVAVSHDSGHTWSDWTAIDTGELRGCAMTGPILHWPDGTLGFAFESFKEFDDPRPGHHAAWLKLSRDGGRTFGPAQQVARHPENSIYYWDQRLCCGPGVNEFSAFFWTHDLVSQKDLTVHRRQGSVDSTGRLHVQPLIDSQIPGQIAAPLWWDDQHLLVFVVDRHRPGTMSLWGSSDKGHTWPADQRLIVYTHDEQAALSQGHEGIDFNQYWEDMGRWTFGHPALRRLPDGLLLVAWYAGSPQRMSLHWARLEVRS